MWEASGLDSSKKKNKNKAAKPTFFEDLGLILGQEILRVEHVLALKSRLPDTNITLIMQFI